MSTVWDKSNLFKVASGDPELSICEVIRKYNLSNQLLHSEKKIRGWVVKQSQLRRPVAKYQKTDMWNIFSM